MSTDCNNDPKTSPPLVQQAAEMAGSEPIDNVTTVNQLRELMQEVNQAYDQLFEDNDRVIELWKGVTKLRNELLEKEKQIAAQWGWVVRRKERIVEAGDRFLAERWR